MFKSKYFKEKSTGKQRLLFKPSFVFKLLKLV